MVRGLEQEFRVKQGTKEAQETGDRAWVLGTAGCAVPALSICSTTELDSGSELNTIDSQAWKGPRDHLVHNAPH